MSDAEKKQAYTLLKQPASIPLPGKKTIGEFIGKLNTGTEKFSAARMAAPAGWEEPEQTTEFDEIIKPVYGSVCIPAFSNKTVNRETHKIIYAETNSIL